MQRASAAPAKRAAGPAKLDCLGPWRCVRRLGRGRWTEVYQAAPQSHLHPSADYVLKTLRPEFRDDSLPREMLERQALLGRTLTDPHLESVLAAHLDAPPYYLVMPLMEGASLRATLDHARRLAAPQALWFARQMAEGLAALHRHGWLHGDIKPANVFVSSSGHVTLIDLGLAHRTAQRPDHGRLLTGTPAYTAPEYICAGIPPGPFSDMYSLGATLFEMLTGQPPFTANAPAELLRAHQEQPVPDPRRFVPGLPRRVSRLLRSMLAKQPLRRPGLDELVERLFDLEIDTLQERLE